MKDIRIQAGLHAQQTNQAKKAAQTNPQQPSQSFGAVLHQSLQAQNVAPSQQTRSVQALQGTGTAQRLGADVQVRQDLAGAEEAYDDLLKMQNRISQMYHQLSKPKTTEE